MLTNVASSIFTGANTVEMTPVVSAEWNQNLFNPPYLTVAGDGVNVTFPTGPTGATVTAVTGTSANPYFTTKSFTLSGNTGYVSYSNTSISSPSSAYKIVTYVKTSSSLPVMINAYVKGTRTQFGSSSVDANSYGWTKVITYVGGNSSSDTISSLTYTLNINTYSTDTTNPTIYYTVPEIYKISYFSYQNKELWPSDSPFTNFRPGESYVQTGDTNFAFPTGYRQVSSTTITNLIAGFSDTTYAPVSAITQNPSLSIISNPVPFFKNVMPSSMNSYKYFVSDTSSKNISALYPQNIMSNKIVLKFNTIMTTPTVSVYLDGTSIGSFTPDAKGLLVLYYNGTSWSTTKWSTVPTFTSSGTVSIAYASFKKIQVSQTSQTTNTRFGSTYFSNTTLTTELTRMHLVEVSPRFELDLTNFVQSVTINKSLDGKNTYLPVSSVNSNDASIILSGIPAVSGSSPISLFSNNSNQTASILGNMLRKNVKFYVNYNLKSHSQTSGTRYTSDNTYIPAGVFYSDAWDEADIKDITIQCYDVTRYLQSVPVSDYVSNLESVFDIITNILDLSGFTDYDIDSLYTVCNDKSLPVELFYYYCNSKDSTIIDALSQIFLAHQIGAYIDEYGVMKFLSLANILNSTTSLITIDDSSIVEGGYSVSNKAKPGKISLRYNPPIVKQGKATENVTNIGLLQSPSYEYTPGRDVVWSQESADSVGFNYLNGSMLEKSNKFTIGTNVVNDIFHTIDMNSSGYAFIENEIVSLLYKEYKIYKTSLGLSDPNLTTVAVKNDLELSSEVNKFIKKASVGLKTSTGTSFSDFDVTVTFSGYFTNVQRGMFGTSPSDHLRISSALSEKSLTEKVMSSSYVLSTGTNTAISDTRTLDANVPSVKRIATSATSTNKTIIYPTSVTDNGYSTYSVQFDMPDQSLASAGLFFNMASTTSSTGAYFVEFVRYNQTDPKTSALYSPAKYAYSVILYNAAGVIAWADITGQCNNIVKNFDYVFVASNTTPKTYTVSSDQVFNLKVVHYPSTGEDGESTGEVFTAFINNFEITSWQIPTTSTNLMATGWTSTDKNLITGLRKKPILGSTVTAGTVFGFFSSISPKTLTGITYPSSSTTLPANLREIHACQKPLKERSVNYWYQDREFLSAMVQDQNLYTKYDTYLMQTNPSVSGINVYDIQYSNPAATTVDIWPIHYMITYAPSEELLPGQNYRLAQYYDEYSLSYSSILNTGYRAKFAIANNSQHLVYLSKQSTDLVSGDSKCNLITYQIIAPSEPEIIESIIDQSNITEVVQIDSEWIQSKNTASIILANIQKGIDGFTKDVSLSIFGNPLIQVGDIITLTYTLAGLKQQKYVVHSVSQSFNNGLQTNLVLNMVDRGVSY